MPHRLAGRRDGLATQRGSRCSSRSVASSPAAPLLRRVGHLLLRTARQHRAIQARKARDHRDPHRRQPRRADAGHARDAPPAPGGRHASTSPRASTRSPPPRRGRRSTCPRRSKPCSAPRSCASSASTAPAADHRATSGWRRRRCQSMTGETRRSFEKYMAEGRQDDRDRPPGSRSRSCSARRWSSIATTGSRPRGPTSPAGSPITPSCVWDPGSTSPRGRLLKVHLAYVANAAAAVPGATHLVPKVLSRFNARQPGTLGPKLKLEGAATWLMDPATAVVWRTAEPAQGERTHCRSPRSWASPS